MGRQKIHGQTVLSPPPGLKSSRHLNPRLKPWATIVRCSAACPAIPQLLAEGWSLPVAASGRARPSGRATACAALRRDGLCRRPQIKVGTGALRRSLRSATTVRRFPVRRRTASPFRWPMWRPRQRGHRSAMVPTGLCPKSCKD